MRFRWLYQHILSFFLDLDETRTKAQQTEKGAYAAYPYRCPRIQEASDILRNRIRDEPERQRKIIVLRFSADVCLSTKHYLKEGTTSNRLDIEMIPYGYRQDVLHAEKNEWITLKRTRDLVVWKVAFFEEEQRVVVKKDVASAGAAHLSALFSQGVRLDG